MKAFLIGMLMTAVLLRGLETADAQQTNRPYRLNAVDLKQRVIWGAECVLPDGQGLAFGGQDQDAIDGRPHTRVLKDGEWVAVHRELRAKNPLQSLHGQTWALRQSARNVLGLARFIFFRGLTEADEIAQVKRDVDPRLQKLEEQIAELSTAMREGQPGADQQAQFAHRQMQLVPVPKPVDGKLSADFLQSLHQLQIRLELAAEALDCEPPARAMNCGTARLSGNESRAAGNTLVFDSKTKLYVLFGGDHLDYLTNDTWVFDPAMLQWSQRHPERAPPPRANHQLEAAGDGTVRMTGGYTYSSNTDYVGGQYRDLDGGTWVYDIAKHEWSGGELVPADERVYRTGPFHPDFYLQGPRPDAGKFEQWLNQLPVNEWVPTNPPHRPRLNRDWGTARIDPHRDMILRWSGGHSAHGGTDVLHFHFSTNRWELPFPVEFPLGQLYSNTSYPNGFNFNLRPWMTGHTYQNYDYDPPSRKMIKAGRPRHHYIYDPDVGDWIGRGTKPAAMQYNSCFYTLTLTATPHGVVCWDGNGRVHRYDHTGNKWVVIELTGDRLPGAYVDNSTIAYDSKRDRVLMINTLGYGKPFDGQVWSLDPTTGIVNRLSPPGREQADRFANVDKCCYDADNDILLLGTYLKDSGDHTPTPAYDCKKNCWVTLDIRYATGERSGNTTRAFPHVRSDGLMFDAGRKLIWGTDTNSQVYVLRLDVAQLKRQPLQ
ncbi:MAG: kelch repeat-containing protein [Planctomycetota bacterium]|nr:kelch repeat-containing protein [Planctomycetota bacterium]MDA1251505.1 kelch repeat-containing protein [Planctomycetota bacterium]